MNIIRKAAACILLTSVYSFTLLMAVLGQMIPRRPWKPTGRIMVTGTIFNPNWYLSHITPLTRSGLKEVILVIDEPQQPLEGVRFACPPKWLSKLLSRAGAKAIWMIFAGFRYRPDLLMGYNLVAGSCTALITGSLLGRPSCYQMTGQQLALSTIDKETFYAEKVSGGHQKILKAIERLAVCVIRHFDLIIVRGNKGKAFLAGYGIEKNIAIITGSVKGDTQCTGTDRDIDLIFVGRLNPIKQVDQFIRIVSEISLVIPAIRSMIVGDGELMADMKAFASQLGINGRIEFLGKREDVEDILARSKIFILTSKSEGMSIALLEAMASGAVPVVADVGELGDIVASGRNGYLVTPNRIPEYSERVLSLLQNRDLWSELSSRAIETSRKYCDIDVASEKWRQCLRNAVSQASGCHLEDVWN